MSIHRIAFALAAALALCVVPARAGLIITIDQVGPDVVATGSGSVNLTGLTFNGSILSAAGVTPIFGNVTFGEAGPTSGDDYGPLMGPSSFGPGIGNIPTSSSGDTFGVVNGDGSVRVPGGYTSGTPLTGTDTFANSTISGLGLILGMYNYTLPNDTITVIIGVAVPEPSTLALASIGALAGLGVWARQRLAQAGVRLALVLNEAFAEK
jgi:PEP-CTERM motif